MSSILYYVLNFEMYICWLSWCIEQPIHYFQFLSGRPLFINQYTILIDHRSSIDYSTTSFRKGKCEDDSNIFPLFYRLHSVLSILSDQYSHDVDSRLFIENGNRARTARVFALGWKWQWQCCFPRSNKMVASYAMLHFPHQLKHSDCLCCMIALRHPVWFRTSSSWGFWCLYWGMSQDQPVELSTPHQTSLPSREPYPVGSANTERFS